MNISDGIAVWMVGKGIKHAFGIVGGGNVPLFEAIHQRGYTEIIACHHEQAAAMAASYYYRVCGKIAPCLVTTGAGSANAITGVLAAWMDSIPLMVISGNEASHYMGAETRIWGVQGYGSCELAAPITKLAMRPVIKYFPACLDFAYNEMMDGRPGPVWLDFPKNIQVTPWK